MHRVGHGGAEGSVGVREETKEMAARSRHPNRLRAGSNISRAVRMTEERKNCRGCGGMGGAGQTLRSGGLRENHRAQVFSGERRPS